MSIELKSNLGGRLNKIRAGVVYHSVTAVIGELTQNAQRAGATKLDIYLDSNTLVIEDNGKGCDDPQVVFELDTSGFGMGFGEGFSSVFTIADKLTVQSKGWSVSLDVLKVLEGNDYSLDVVKNKHRNGFLVAIDGERIRVNHDELDTFIRANVGMLPMDVTYNGEKIERVNLLANVPNREAGDFNYNVSNDLYDAVLTPSNWTDFKLYFESRFVCDMWVSGATGNIILKPDAVSLKAPDRRALVTDDKYYAFKEQLSKDIAAMYKEFVQGANNQELETYADGIDRYLKPQDYMHFLQLDEGMFKALRLDEQYADLTDEEIYTQFGLTPPVVSHFSSGGSTSTRGGENYDPMGEFTQVEVGFGEARHEGNSSLSTPLLNTRPKRADSTNFLEKLKQADNLHKVLWISSSDYELYKQEIEQYEYYGFAVVIAHNKLYTSAYESLGVKCFHDVEKDVRKKHKFENVGTQSKKEERIMWLLERIEEHFKLPGIFRIADVSCTVEHYRNGLLVDAEHKITHGVAHTNKHSGSKIYLNRKSLQLPTYRVSNWDSVTITLNDMRILLKNVETIAHELAHIIGGEEATDGSKTHEALQSKIQKEIADLF